MKALFMRREKLDQDLRFTRCVVEKAKAVVKEAGENWIKPDMIRKATVECYKDAYGKPIGTREEPKYYGDLDRARVIMGQPKTSREGFTPEFRTSRPAWYMLNPDFFAWEGEPRKIAESYIKLNIFARTILRYALKEKGVQTITVNELRDIAIEALHGMLGTGNVDRTMRTYVEALLKKLEGKRSVELVTKGFVIPISLLSGNTLLAYDSGRIALTRELQKLLMPEASVAAEEITPPEMLGIILETYISVTREMLGREPPQSSGVPVPLGVFERKLAEKLGLTLAKAREYIRKAKELCPDGIMIEDFDVLRVKREPQVYIVPGRVEACKSEMGSAS